MVWFVRKFSKYVTTRFKSDKDKKNVRCGFCDFSTVANHFVLLLILALYSFLGGWIFLKLESTSEIFRTGLADIKVENATKENLTLSGRTLSTLDTKWLDKKVNGNYELLYTWLIANLTEYARNSEKELNVTRTTRSILHFWKKFVAKNRDLFGNNESKIYGLDSESRFKFRLAVAVWRDHHERTHESVGWLKSLLINQTDTINSMFLLNGDETKDMGSKIIKSLQSDESDPWNIWSSTLYATTLYTTIGYGNLAPKSWQGRLVTMIYSLIGMPLLLVILRVNGTFIYDMVLAASNCFHHSKQPIAGQRTLYNKRYSAISSNLEVKNLHHPDASSNTGDENQSNNGLTPDLPLFSAIILLIVWMCLCAGLFLLWEDDWDYFTSWYFFFITTTTIGLGDVVPNHPRFALLAFIFVLIGLSVVSMNLNVIQGKVELLFDSLMKSIDAQYKQQLDPENCAMLQEQVEATSGDENGPTPKTLNRAGSKIKNVFQLLAQKKSFKDKLVVSLLMDNHRKKMLQDYWTEKACKVNAAVQTAGKKYVSIDVQCDMDEELSITKNGKPRKYIYNLFD
uniref:Potassium channel domain-containing protein n=1 Tax=Romanomermis culicivorax TaxID=13658 RepID=A0A915KW45_ROMCU